MKDWAKAKPSHIVSKDDARSDTSPAGDDPRRRRRRGMEMEFGRGVDLLLLAILDEELVDGGRLGDVAGRVVI